LTVGIPQATRAAVAFGDHPLSDRQRPELAGLQLAAQPFKEALHAVLSLDVAASLAVDPGCP
jgi:hypothetical protein